MGESGACGVYRGPHSDLVLSIMDVKEVFALACCPSSQPCAPNVKKGGNYIKIVSLPGLGKALTGACIESPISY